MRIYSPCCACPIDVPANLTGTRRPVCPDCKESFVVDIDGDEAFVEPLVLATPAVPVERWGSPFRPLNSPMLEGAAL